MTKSFYAKESSAPLAHGAGVTGRYVAAEEWFSELQGFSLGIIAQQKVETYNFW